MVYKFVCLLYFLENPFTKYLAVISKTLADCNTTQIKIIFIILISGLVLPLITHYVLFKALQVLAELIPSITIATFTWLCVLLWRYFLWNVFPSKLLLMNRLTWHKNTIYTLLDW